MIARPALTRRCGGHRASAGAASARAGDDGELNGNRHQPGHQRAAPAGVLQVQRRQGDGRAGRQRVQQSTGRTLPQWPQAKHCRGQQRRRCAPVHDDEHARQDDRHRQQRGAQRCPAGLRQQRRRDDERHHRAGEGADARHAEADRPVTSPIRRHSPPDGHGQQHSQRKVSPRTPPHQPTRYVTNQPADNKPARARGRPRRAPGRDGPLPLRPVGGDRGQQPQCRRHRQRRGATLQAPRRRQHHRRGSGRPHDSGHGEDRQAGKDDAPVTKPVPQPRAEQQQPGEEHGIASRDQAGCIRRRVQVRQHRRQRRHHDGHPENIDELHQAQPHDTQPHSSRRAGVHRGKAEVTNRVTGVNHPRALPRSRRHSHHQRHGPVVPDKTVRSGHSRSLIRPTPSR